MEQRRPGNETREDRQNTLEKAGIGKQLKSIKAGQTITQAGNTPRQEVRCLKLKVILVNKIKQELTELILE